MSTMVALFVGLQALLTILIPFFASIFHDSCTGFCILSDEEGFFLLFNYPGLIFLSNPWINNLIKTFETEQQRLSGEFTLPYYIITFILAAIFYYIFGMIVETIWQKKIPTLLGILLVAIGIGLTSLVIKQET